MSTHPTEHSELQQLAREFAVWRSRRVNRRCAVPDNLRNKAVMLLQMHPKIHVARALGITGRMLRQWVGAQPETKLHDTPFIRLIQEPSSVRIDHNDLTQHAHRETIDITLTLHATNRIRIEGRLSPTQLTTVLRAFGGGT